MRLKLTLLLAAVGIIASANVATGAEPEAVKPNYELAERFSPTKVRRLVPQTSVRPNWFESQTKFWYKWQTVDAIIKENDGQVILASDSHQVETLDFYFEEAKKLSIFIQLEHKDAIDCLDELMEIEEIDGYIFGPNDLSGSYGMMGKVFSPEITEIIAKAIERLHAKGKYVIIASGGFSEEIISHWSKFMPDMIFAGADFDFIRDGAVRNRQNLERIHKKT